MTDDDDEHENEIVGVDESRLEALEDVSRFVFELLAVCNDAKWHDPLIPADHLLEQLQMLSLNYDILQTRPPTEAEMSDPDLVGNVVIECTDWFIALVDSLVDGDAEDEEAEQSAELETAH